MSKRAELIYLMDPHCGWCYGFSGTMHEVVAHFQDDEHLELSLVAGGLFHPALASGPSFAEEKRPIAGRVSRHFDVQFSEDYFGNVLASGHLDSLVPCEVINAVKIVSPEAAFAFAERLISAAFTKGRNISDLSVCLDVVRDGGVDAEDVKSALSTTAVVEMTESSFVFAHLAGTGFPSIFLKTTEALTHLGGVELDLNSVKAHVEKWSNRFRPGGAPRV